MPVSQALAHHSFATQISEDPEVFQGLAARLIAWRKVDGEYVYPYECDASFGD